MACLNLKSKEAQKWVKGVGVDELYRQFILHNYKLPGYESWYREQTLFALSKIERDKVLKSFLTLENGFSQKDSTEFKTKHLNSRVLGAFLKNTFIFGEGATKLHVYEEAFHAIFQSLTSSEERDTLLQI